MNDIQHNALNYAECRVIFTITLNVIMLIVVMQNVVMLFVVASKLQLQQCFITFGLQRTLTIILVCHHFQTQLQRSKASAFIFIEKTTSVNKTRQLKPEIGSAILQGPSPLQGQVPSLACKYYTWVVVTNSVKHSSLLWYGINYARKKFFDTGPNIVKLFTAVSYAFS